MTDGRVAENFIIQSVDGEFSSELPRLLECDALPDNKSEIATPDVTLAHPHLRHLAGKIHPLDTNAEIMLLLGSDIVQVHKVLECINGPVNAPFAQKLALGWVIVGDVCLGGTHKPPRVATDRTTVLQDRRPSLLPPCQNSFHVKEHFQVPSEPQATRTARQKEDYVFQLQQTENDERVAPSLEAKQFVQRHFYVPTDSETAKLLKDTQELLAAFNLSLHKIASDSPNIMAAFPKEDLTNGLRDFNTEFLLKPTAIDKSDTFQLQDLETDTEIRLLLTAVSQAPPSCLKSSKMQAFSSMGNNWELMIGTPRRILDCPLAQLEPQRLSHEVTALPSGDFEEKDLRRQQ
ncbi:uncharacterized protein LOC109514483 [Hippocampus comes]|uniref:uncharacterized protein LOC109514483 n=1 Tax=Hippocampus comes TaxID=109280 RepID=UPI00094F345E|nr:PREDICTED: uncharacterized protein LOC109514483 [Hippocampus comes]